MIPKTPRRRRRRRWPRTRRWSGRNSAPTAPSSTEIGDKAKTDAAFAKAAQVVGIEFVNNRLVSNYMEARAAIGEWKPDEDRFVLTTGIAGRARHARHRSPRTCSRSTPEQLRVITPDVGGGFGTEGFVYREYPLVLEAAKRLGRPVKWVARPHRAFPRRRAGPRQYRRRPRWRSTRTAASSACEIDLIANMGAYLSQYGPFIPYVGATMSTGVYDIAALDVTGSAASTPTPAGRRLSRRRAARGRLSDREAGRCSRAASSASAATRSARRNFIRPEQLPYTHADRPALRRRRVRRPYDAGHGRGRLGELRAAPEAAAGRRARSAASAWRPISRPAPSPAPRPAIVQPRTATAR